MNLATLKFGIFMALAIFLTTPVAGQTNEKKANEPTTAIAAYELAAQLSSLGYAQRDPLLLVAAAKLTLSYTPRKLEVTKDEPSKGTSDGKKGDKAPQLDASKLLSDAKAMASDNKNVLGIIDEIEKTAVPSRGRAAGPAYAQRRVYANSTYTDYILFNAGELAEVGIVGDGDTDLDLYVYDENGNFIASDTRYGDRCYVSFTPKWKGSFKIIVKNYGNFYNDYVLMSN